MKLKDIIDNSDLEQVFQILLARLNKYSKDENYSIEQIRSFYGAELVGILIAGLDEPEDSVITVHGDECEEIALLKNISTGKIDFLAELETIDGVASLEVETTLTNENALAGILHDISILKEI